MPSSASLRFCTPMVGVGEETRERPIVPIYLGRGPAIASKGAPDISCMRGSSLYYGCSCLIVCQWPGVIYFAVRRFSGGSSHGDGNVCVDIDECAGDKLPMGGCAADQGICLNTVGSYVSHCHVCWFCNVCYLISASSGLCSGCINV